MIVAALRSRNGGRSAVVQKIGAAETASEVLKGRAGTAKRGDLTRILDRAPDAPPLPKDSFCFAKLPRLTFQVGRADKD
ncbi:hypothetical protein [Allomesorhizobium alhagi]|uniref:Uncharacterized protein n=1 Tax=Mesorhizobium alhagi CCNWXJ12-2 TaxID=1107882 RepID=H0HX35_9HYPH|nr:hypothetical protein [Mesorhizobium alhagi]EHK54632.1 hypothetical protein MAXJ12_23772 [Mesorhizobium alhagi CCNWXJ12-2]